MNNKIIKEVDKILKERRLIVLERTKMQKKNYYLMKNMHI